MNLSDIAILNIKIANYCCIISGINQNESINVSRIKIGKEILTFRDIEIEKNKFYRNKTPIF